jgi:hypothetical protein
VKLPSLWSEGYLIYVPGLNRIAATTAHLRERDVNYWPFHGINGETAGLSCTNHHDLPDGSKYTPTPKHVSLCINHWMIWSRAHMEHDDPGDFILVMEDDVRFVDDWDDKLQQALLDVPEDWDMLFLGSCYARHHGAAHVKGSVYKLDKPNCTHAYLVRVKALPTLLRDCERIYTNIDWAIAEQVGQKLKIFAILPRIAHQHTMENLPE